MKARDALFGALALGASMSATAGDIRVTSCQVFDDCYCHDSDSSIDPAEFVLLRIGFENVGATVAQNLRGNVAVVAGARALSGFGAFGPLAPIGPGETYDHAVFLEVDAPCETLMDIDINGLTTTSAPGSHPPAPIVCDYIVGAGGEGECTPCCLPEDIEAIERVYAVKVDSDDVYLSWAPDPSPSASRYNVWQVSGSANRAEIPNARHGGAWPTVPACDQTFWTHCRDFNATAGAGGDIRYYQVRGVCGSIEAVE